MVADYVATMKRIKQRNLNERLGDLAYKSEIKEKTKPIVESNEKASTAITNELKPMKKEIRDLNRHLRGQDLIVPGRKRKFDSGGAEDRDMYFGVYGDPQQGFYLGNKAIIVDKDRNIHVQNEIYKGTPGLWKLIFDINPTQYTKEDWNSYKKLAQQTDLKNNPSGIQHNSRPKFTKKYKLLMKAYDEEDEEGEEGNREEEKKEIGSGITSFLPGTIKGLLDKLKLLSAEFIAGNTTTRNELVAILDQLLKRGHITEKQYTSINTFLSQ